MRVERTDQSSSGRTARSNRPGTCVTKKQPGWVSAMLLKAATPPGPRTVHSQTGRVL